MRPRSWKRPTSGCTLLLLLLGTAGCRSERATAPAPGASPAASVAPPLTEAPTAPECERLWSQYHDIVPESPYVDHEGFVTRCAQSGRAVLRCVDRTKADMEAMLAEVNPPDAGPPEPMDPRFLTFAVGTRIGVCMTRERLLGALRTGELDRLAREVASDGGATGRQGLRVVGGSYATLPWRGVHEKGRAAEIAPPGEIRVVQRPDGRSWIYFLGALLGRHQNQIGFLYSNAPFVPADFTREPDHAGAPGREEVCLGDGKAPSDERDAVYMLRCFGVIEHLSPQLVQVGASPD